MVVGSDSDEITSTPILANPETTFDRWMRDQIEAIFGLDLGAAPDPSNESLGVLADRHVRATGFCNTL